MQHKGQTTNFTDLQTPQFNPTDIDDQNSKIYD